MIYFVQVGRDGPVKIGFTRNLVRRYRRLRGQYPGKSVAVLNFIEGTRPDERRMHYRFGKLWIEKELFRLDGELLDYLRSLPEPSLKGFLGPNKTGGALFRSL